MKWLKDFFRKPDPAPEPRMLLPEAVVQALSVCLAPAQRRRHEGVAFLLGRTGPFGATGLVAVRPKAVTTFGSFHVPGNAMAEVVALATRFGLQIVAQVHTHPGSAYHSDGDEDGANIRYPGYFSIVVPDHGRHLPNLKEAAVYRYVDGDWTDLGSNALVVLKSGVVFE